MRTHQNFVAVGAGALLACSLLAACSSGDGDPNAISVRSAITPSGALTGPFLYAIDHGYYKKAGLEVTVSDGKGSLSVAKDVAQGNIDIGQVGSPTVAQTVNEGLPLISVAQEYGRGSYGLIVDAASGVDSYADLAGKSVVVSAGSPETLLLPAVLDKAGVDPGSVKMLNVDAAVKGTTYAGGEGDALGTTVPFFMPLVEDQRESIALPFDEAGVPFPDYSLVVRKDFLDDNEEQVRTFLEASFAGFAAAAKDPQGVGDSLRKHRSELSNIGPQVKQFEAYQEFTCASEQSGHPVGWHSPDAWSEALETFHEYGGLSGDVRDLGAYYTNRFFEGDDAVGSAMCGDGGVE